MELKSHVAGHGMAPVDNHISMLVKYVRMACLFATKKTAAKVIEMHPLSSDIKTAQAVTASAPGSFEGSFQNGNEEGYLSDATEVTVTTTGPTRSLKRINSVSSSASKLGGMKRRRKVPVASNSGATSANDPVTPNRPSASRLPSLTVTDTTIDSSPDLDALTGGAAMFNLPADDVSKTSQAIALDDHVVKAMNAIAQSDSTMAKTTSRGRNTGFVNPKSAIDFGTVPMDEELRLTPGHGRTVISHDDTAYTFYPNHAVVIKDRCGRELWSNDVDGGALLVWARDNGKQSE
jgi:hypothetical protein